MAKKETILWMMSGCSSLIGAVGGAMGIAAFSKADKAIGDAEPASAQWKAAAAAAKEEGADMRWVATLDEREAVDYDTNWDRINVLLAQYVVSLAETEDNDYDESISLWILEVEGEAYDGEPMDWDFEAKRING